MDEEDDAGLPSPSKKAPPPKRSGGICTSRHMRKWQLLTMLAALAYIGVAIFTFMQMSGLTSLVKDMMPKAIALITGSFSSSLGNGGVLGGINPDILLAVRNYVAYLDFAAMGPALFSAVMMLLAALISCFSGSGYCCSKVFIVLSDVFVLLTLGYYLFVAGLGLLHDRPVLTDRWQDILSLCTENRPLLTQALAEAQASIDAASGMTPGTVGTIQAQLDYATSALTNFDGLCSDLGSVPLKLQQLTWPGIVGFGVSVTALVLLNGLCCATGCCRSPNAPAKAPRKSAIAPEEAFDEDDL